MTQIEQTIDVDVPVREAYDQWTQFEEFPAFMQGIKEVRQHDDTHLHWVAEVAGRTKEWEAEIVEQVPDERVTWRATDGTPNAGTVTFHPLGADRTRIAVAIDHEPEGFVERAGGLLGLDERRVKGDLERFKDLIERRGTASGAWRGEVHAEGATETAFWGADAANLEDPPQPTGPQPGPTRERGAE